MRRCLVSSFLADVTQQTHSFLASGVIAAQRFFAAASDSMARRKSDGSLWIVPSAIALVVMDQLRRVSCRPTARFSTATCMSKPLPHSAFLRCHRPLRRDR